MKSDHEEEEEEQSEEQEDKEEQEEEQVDNLMVDIQFEFFNPKEEDFHAIKVFLTNYLEGQAFDSSELTDVIIKQGETFGSTIKVEDNEPFGFISVINLHSHKDKEFVKQLKSYLFGKLQNEPAKLQYIQKLCNDESKPLGLILSERMMNIPSQLAPHLHKSLFEELNWTIEENEGTASKYAFKNYLMIVGSYKEIAENTKSKSESEEAFYFKEEEEIYHKESAMSFTYPYVVEKKQDQWTLLECEIKQFRTILAFPSTKIPTILAQIQKIFTPAEQ